MILEENKTYVVTVVRLGAKGVIVEMSDNSTEFIHISKISDNFVSNVAAFATVGHPWKVVGVRNKKLNRVELSHRDSDINIAEGVYDSVSTLSRIPKNPNPYSNNKKSLYNTSSKSLDDMIADANRALADKRRDRDDGQPKPRKRKR